MLTTCIICLDYWNPEELEGVSENAGDTDVKVLQCRNKNKFIFHNFCRNFNIPLNALGWDFSKETLPFCKQCRESAETLVRLQQKLRDITNSIHNVEKVVQSKIIGSSQRLQQQQVYNDATTLQVSSKELRVKRFRDLIVGPCLKLPRLTMLPKSTPSFTQFASREIKQEKISEVGEEEAALEDNPQIFDNHDATDDVEFDDMTSDYLDENDISGIDYFAFGVGEETVKRPRRKNPSRATKNKRFRSKKSKNLRPLKIEKDVVKSKGKLCKEIPRKIELIDSQDISRVSVEREFDDSQNPEISSDASTKRYMKEENVDNDNNEKLDDDNQPVERPSRNKKSKIVHVEDSESEESSSDDDYDDDLHDKDFILPDDAVDTLKEDSKLHSKIASALRYKREGKSSNKNCKLRVTKKDEDGKFGYGDFEFTGSANEGYICSLCPQTKCRQLRGITQHIRQKHIDTSGHVCSICGKIIASSQGLKKHISIHERVEGVMCQYCGGSYTDSKGLELHISLVHFPEYKFPCDLCDKKFRQISQVNKHKRAVHLKEKRFYCDRCSKGFFDSGALNMHLKTHSSDQPFSCDMCGQRFNRQCHKRRHIKQFHELKVTDNSLQNKELQSSTNYAKLASLRESQPDILPDDSILESLKCPHCGLQYNRQNNLTRHLLQIHHINVKGVAWKSRRPPNGDASQKRRKKNNAQGVSAEQPVFQDIEVSTEQEVESRSSDNSTVGNSVPSSSSKHSMFITLPNSEPIPGLGHRLKTDVHRNYSVLANLDSAVEVVPHPPNQNRFESSTNLQHQFSFGGTHFV